jgi:ubiquitin-protein ligase
MSVRRTKRILNEIKEIKESEEILLKNGIHVIFDENDISDVYALLVGPEGTPYEKGYYFFKFTYSQEYPMTPPIATFYTQGVVNYRNKISNSVRFNPNLYTCGKVCLSMLNTWSGPGWVPTNTLTNVLIAIQALVFNNEPLKNEPGYEYSNDNTIQKYSELITYANIRIGVFQMVHNPPFIIFKDKLLELYYQHKDYYKDFINKKIIEYNHKILHLDLCVYGLKCSIDYNKLMDEFELFDDIEEELKKK